MSTAPAPADHLARLRVIAVAGGKGGVGKTQLAVNLAVELADAGERVLLIDADVGMCNAELLLDVCPAHGLVDVVRGAAAIEDALVVTPHGPTLLSGHTDDTLLANGLDDREALALIGALDSIGGRFDVVLIDTAAGVGKNALFFAGAAEEVLLVTTPEPTALVDTYATARALLLTSSRRSIGLVVNQAQGQAVAAAVHRRLEMLVRRFLAAEVDLVGWIPFDAMVHDAVMRQSPFVNSHPSAPASRQLRSLARRVQNRPIRTSDGMAELRFFWTSLQPRGVYQ